MSLTHFPFHVGYPQQRAYPMRPIGGSAGSRASIRGAAPSREGLPEPAVLVHGPRIHEEIQPTRKTHLSKLLPPRARSLRRSTPCTPHSRRTELSRGRCADMPAWRAGSNSAPARCVEIRSATWSALPEPRWRNSTGTRHRRPSGSSLSTRRRVRVACCGDERMGCVPSPVSVGHDSRLEAERVRYEASTRSETSTIAMA
jgi:hypothetical protein